MKKVNCIMLIDDDEPTNFLHQLVVEEADCCNVLVTVDSAFDALDYLNGESSILPNIIYLDINMPRMNGWQFLERYSQLPEDRKSSTIIIMLTTSLNPSDKRKAATISEISDYQNKPLTVELLEKSINMHYASHSEHDEDESY